MTEDRIRILTGGHLLEPFRRELGEMDSSSFLVEPQARGTGPVLVWAAWEISQVDPNAVMASLHADHAIAPLSAFQTLIRDGTRMAKTTDALFTVAVPPTRPETGYGYIQPGDALPQGEGETEAFRVRSFVEKPDLDTAREYVEAGFLWNSGIFLWRTDLFLEEVSAVAPELGSLIPLLEEGDVEGFFQKAPAISVDEAVLERSSPALPHAVDRDRARRAAADRSPARPVGRRGPGSGRSAHPASCSRACRAKSRGRSQGAQRQAKDGE